MSLSSAALSLSTEEIVPGIQFVTPGVDFHTDKNSLHGFDLDPSSIDPSCIPSAVRVPRRGLDSPLAGLGAFELKPLPAYIPGRSRLSSFVGSTPAVKISQEPSKHDGLAADPVLSALPTLHFAESIKSVISTSQAAIFRRKSRLYFFALCWSLYVEGWNDGSIGPLLPVIQRDYHVGFSIVSLLFVSNCIGFITGAFMNVWLNDRFGFGKVMVIGAMCQIITYSIQSPAPPFPIMVLVNGLTGFGMSLQNAQANGFVGSQKEHVPTMLGMLHASYGLGALTSPLVATHFSRVRHWSFHYLISAGMAVSNTLLLILVFRFKTQDELLAEAGQEPGEVNTRRENKYRQIMGLRAVHFLAIFALIYIGVEVSIGGWIVTFIIRERDGGPSAGYISSGFFGGLTLGRVGLMWLNKRVGEHRVLFIYALLAIALEVTIWVVPSIIQNAVAVSFIGLLLGPMFPILVNHAAHIFPRWLLTGCVGWITGIGMAGSAALPFITGLLASRYGIGSLQPLMVTMMATMVAVWAFVPKGQSRVD